MLKKTCQQLLDSEQTYVLIEGMWGGGIEGMGLRGLREWG